MWEETKTWFWNWRLIGGIIIVAAVLAGGCYWFVAANRDSNPIPQQIRTQLPFSPFVLPTGTKNYSTSDYKLATVEDNTKMLSYIIRGAGTSVTLSEYTQPQQFTDIPEYKDRFLANVTKQYDTVQTANGIIHLGRMTRDDNRQLAVMIEQGLIVFMRPDKGLDQTQWHNLGDQLVLQKLTN
jgi:hypothetical protein